MKTKYSVTNIFNLWRRDKKLGVKNVRINLMKSVDSHPRSYVSLIGTYEHVCLIILSIIAND